MPTKPSKTKPTGTTQNRATNINISPLSADEAMRRVLSISKEDAKRILGTKPGKKNQAK